MISEKAISWFAIIFVVLALVYLAASFLDDTPTVTVGDCWADKETKLVRRVLEIQGDSVIYEFLVYSKPAKTNMPTAVFVNRSEKVNCPEIAK